MNRFGLPVIALAAALASGPVWAQNATHTPAAQAAANIGTATVTTGTPSQRNPLLPIAAMSASAR